MKKYSELLECWEQEAYHDHYGEDWLVEIGEGVKFYAVKCEAEGKRPTFAGLIRHIKKRDAAHRRRMDRMTVLTHIDRAPCGTPTPEGVQHE